jgi:trans-aconitate methyltransferase
MHEIVLAQVPAGRPFSLLDLGCGTGVMLLDLLDTLPNAMLTGIDISHANIRAAECDRLRHSQVERLQFVQGDYLEFQMAPVDVIVADGVIQLVPGPVAPIFQKLARDLRPGGVLICSMPYACFYNRVFSLLRRFLSRVRSNWIDELILRLARAVYGREIDENLLKERVWYMYVAPERLLDPARDPDVSAAGFAVVRQYPMHTRFSQLKYAVTVLKRQ